MAIAQIKAKIISNKNFMDVFAHGLWTGIIFKKYKRKKILWPIFFGVAPDIFSFGIYLFISLISSGFSFFSRSPEHSGAQVPQYVSTLYGLTHSFIIFAVIFLLIWFWRKKPFWPILAWGIHIAIDVPLHSAEFFPTPFLFMVSSFKISSISWGNPLIMILNYSAIAIIYLTIFLKSRKQKTDVNK